MPFFRRLFTTTAVTGVAGLGGWKWYTRNSNFVQFDRPDFSQEVMAQRNPSNNPPALIDCCVRTVPLSELKTADQAALTREFCRGIWSGPGFSVQRSLLERSNRALEGRSDHLWETEDMRQSDYKLGTKIADHFEVVERTNDRVVVRCGDSPHVKEHRPSDGLFTIEVNKDDAKGVAHFKLKSFFFNSTFDGSVAGNLPWWLPALHREYTKLWDGDQCQATPQVDTNGLWPMMSVFASRPLFRGQEPSF